MSPESAKNVQKQLVADAGREFLTLLDQARGVIKALEASFSVFPHCPDINQAAITDAHRFLDATAEKFMEVIVDSNKE